MAEAPDRQTVDLSAYPDLVAIYLGMRVEDPDGPRPSSRCPRRSSAVAEQPDGLLLHRNAGYSAVPLHPGCASTGVISPRSRRGRYPAAQALVAEYLRDPGGTAFWHETYFSKGGIEAIYDDVEPGVGMAAFAPVRHATGPMLGARERADADRSAAGIV